MKSYCPTCGTPNESNGCTDESMATCSSCGAPLKVSPGDPNATLLMKVSDIPTPQQAPGTSVIGK